MSADKETILRPHKNSSRRQMFEMPGSESEHARLSTTHETYRPPKTVAEKPLDDKERKRKEFEEYLWKTMTEKVMNDLAIESKTFYDQNKQFETTYNNTFKIKGFKPKEIGEQLDEEKMGKLIEMVRGFPVLYDTTHEDYMRSKLKDDLWKNIAKELNMDAQTVKEQWRKLRECHREALQRQQKKSGQQATHIRLWTYEKQMEFLKPFMKNRNTVGYPTSPLEENQLEEDAITLHDAPTIEATNDYEPTEPSENVPRKKFKKSTVAIFPAIREFFENTDKIVKQRDELSQNLISETKKQEELKNDGLYQFFMSMFNITKSLPTKYQKEIRRKMFQVISDAEDKADDDVAKKCEVEQNSSPQFSGAITQQFPEFFSPSNST